MCQRQATFYEVYRNACVEVHGKNGVYSLKKLNIDVKKNRDLYSFFKSTQDLFNKKIQFLSWVKSLNLFKDAVQHKYITLNSQKEIGVKKGKLYGFEVIQLVYMVIFKACVDEVCDSYSLIIDTADETDQDYDVKVKFWDRVYWRLNKIKEELNGWFISISTYNDPNMEGAEKLISIDEQLDNFIHDVSYLGLFFERTFMSFKYLLYYFKGYTENLKKGNQNV